MKRLFNDLELDYPAATAEFEEWMMSNYQLHRGLYDESISPHRYMILCRFLGESVDLPKYMMDQVIEERIDTLLSGYESALKQNPADPLETIAEMPFRERNEIMEKTFVRKTNPSLYDCLKPLTNYLLPGLFDTLIPYEGRKSLYAAEIVVYDDRIVSAEEEQLWLDNIQWSYDVKSGKINIPF